MFLSPTFLVSFLLSLTSLSHASFDYRLLNPSRTGTDQGIGWHKHDCGASSQLQCQQQGCIWQPVAEPPEGPIPWCYYWTNRIDCHPEGGTVVHAYDSNFTIVNRASAGATKENCNARGCEWVRADIPALPWCIFQLPEALIDCHPDKNARTERCTRRGCMWIPELGIETPGKPYCAFSGGARFAGYKLQTSSGRFASESLARRSSQTANNILRQGTLKRISTPSIFGQDLDNLHFSVKAITNDHVRIQINTNPDDIKSHSPLIDQYLATPHDTANPNYDVIVANDSFGFAVTRKQDGTVIFDTRNIPGLTIEKQYVQLSTKLPTSFIYGFGENAQLRLKRNVTWDSFGFFSRDIPPNPTANSHQNLYGVHPFFMGVESSSKSYGVYWNNLHGLNVALQDNPDILTYRAIGGMVDIHVILGDNPVDVIKKYVAMIGRPLLPPYWGLGFQLSRYGYKDLQEIKDTVARVQAAGVPLEVQYADIDYMDGYKDFTVGDKFKGLGDYAKQLKDHGMHMVLITDPAIASRAVNYEPLTKGLAYDVFIRNSAGGILEGKVWPGRTYYPDFIHPNATAYWYECLKDFHDKVPFDGMWYDMNEVSNFVNGSISGCPNTPVNHPPFIPVADDPIYVKTLCLDAVHHGGQKEYDQHNLYGYHETAVANKAHRMLFEGQRPFMVSRSTAPGSGVDTAHWSGDVFSNWSTMRYSIINMIQFSMFGISWTGSDICGFLNNTTELLCIRWQQLGAFYPFSRNHNALGSKPQDPGVWSKPAQEAIAKAVLTRYKYLPYLYSLMVRSHIDGSPVVRGMFFDFPNDPESFGLDDQFLLGSLLVAPVTNENNTTKVYFPAGRWYGVEFSSQELKLETGANRVYTYNLDTFGLFARGGSVIPFQEPAATTTKSRENPFGFVVNFDENYSASGELFWDDGVSLNSYETGGEHMHFNLSGYTSCNGTSGYLVAVKDEDTYTTAPSLILDTVQVRGIELERTPTTFKANGKVLDASKINIDRSNGWIELSKLGIEMGTTEKVVITWQ